MAWPQIHQPLSLLTMALRETQVCSLIPHQWFTLGKATSLMTGPGRLCPFQERLSAVNHCIGGFLFLLPKKTRHPVHEVLTRQLLGLGCRHSQPARESHHSIQRPLHFFHPGLNVASWQAGRRGRIRFLVWNSFCRATTELRSCCRFFQNSFPRS
jgi:hypothetical protein